MDLRKTLAMLAAVTAALQCACFAAEGVPEGRFDRLRRGVNVPKWLWGASDMSEAGVRAYFTAEDARMLAKAGFGHVRLPVEVSWLVDWDAPARLKKDSLKMLDEAIGLITGNGLAVVVCPFGDIQDRVFDPVKLPAVDTFWAALAAHLSRTDPEMVFLEVLNEPSGDPETWEPIQRRLLAVMRRGAPHHTLISATTLKSASNPDAWGTPEALVKLKPVGDPNVVYNFHFYEPFWFTHQGASWTGTPVKHIRGLPYPSTPQAVEAEAARLARELSGQPDAWVADVVRDYGRQRWDARKVADRIRLVAQWARKHRVRVTANEFGAYRVTCPPDSRLRWLEDVRRALESQDIGWAVWDYCDGFAIADGKPPARTLDASAIKALMSR